jgi:hypothetical protein
MSKALLYSRWVTQIVAIAKTGQHVPLARQIWPGYLAPNLRRCKNVVPTLFFGRTT